MGTLGRFDAVTDVAIAGCCRAGGSVELVVIVEIVTGEFGAPALNVVL